MGVASKILRALRAQQYNRNLLQEILDPPLGVINNFLCSTGVLNTDNSSLDTVLANFGRRNSCE